MIEVTSARRGARTCAFVGAFLTVLALAAACSVSRRANGEACLKDEDCVSGICSSQVCVSAPTLLDAAVDAEAGPPTVDASDGATDGATDAPADTGMVKDSSAPKDAPHEAADGATDDSASSDSGDAAAD